MVLQYPLATNLFLSQYLLIMIRKSMPLILFSVALLVVAACTEEEEIQKPITGSWTRIHPETSIPVRLTLYDDGSFLFEPMVATELHAPSNGTYTYENSELTLVDDDCPGIEGIYTLLVKCDTVDMSVKDDACSARAAAIDGRWTKE